MDFLKSIFGFSNKEPSTRFTDLRIDDTDDFPYTNIDKKIEEFDKHLSILNDPLEHIQIIHGQIERHFDNFFQFLGVPSFGNFFEGMGFPREFESNFLEDAPREDPNSRETFLKSDMPVQKPFFFLPNDSPLEADKMEKDLGEKFSDQQLSSPEQNSTANYFMDWFRGHRAHQPSDNIVGKSVKVQTIRRPDGSFESHKTITDSSGNEETTITRRMGNKEYTIVKNRDPSGKETVRENIVDMPEDDLPKFSTELPRHPFMGDRPRWPGEGGRPRWLGELPLRKPEIPKPSPKKDTLSDLIYDEIKPEEV